MERMIPLAMLVGAMFLIVAYLIFEHLNRFNPHDNNEQQNFDFGFGFGFRLNAGQKGYVDLFHLSRAS